MATPISNLLHDGLTSAVVRGGGATTLIDVWSAFERRDVVERRLPVHPTSLNVMAKERSRQTAQTDPPSRPAHVSAGQSPEHRLEGTLRVLFFMTNPSVVGPNEPMLRRGGCDRRSQTAAEPAPERLADVNVFRLARGEPFSALKQEWSTLLPDRPTLCHDWLSSWWRYYGPGDGGLGHAESAKSLYVLAVRDQSGVLLGVAPWYRQTTPFGRRVVRFLGSGDVCSDGLTVLAVPGRERRVAEAIADWMLAAVRAGRRPRGQHRDGWDLLELTGVNADDTVARHLADAFARRGAVWDVRDAVACWQLALPDCWEDYLQRLSKSHRKRVRRLTRTYFDTGRARCFRLSDETEIDARFALLCNLHRLRWRPRGRPGAFADRRFRSFHREVFARLCRAGRLRFSWLELDGRPVAAEYQMTAGATVFAYQSGMDPRFADHQPGNLSAIANLQSAIEDGYRQYDFMRGDEPYKAHWRAEPRPTQELRIRPPGIRSRIRQAAWNQRNRTRSGAGTVRSRIARWLKMSRSSGPSKSP